MPVYNEEKSITQSIQKVISVKIPRVIKEIIIIDDGSTDNTAHLIQQVIKRSKLHLNTIKLIKKGKNEGKGAALRMGFLKTTGDIVLVQDGDLEYSPTDYPLLLEPFVTQQADVVYGSRFISDRPHRVLYFWHSVMNAFLTLLSNMCSNLNLTDMETGSKAFRGDLIRKIAPTLVSKRFGFEPEITARISKIPEVNIVEVGVSYAGRTYKEGKKIKWHDGIRAVYEILLFNIFYT